MTRKLTPAVALKRLQKAETARCQAADAVYAAAYPRRDVRFCDCLAIASAEVRAAYEAADRAVSEARWAGHAAGVWTFALGRMWWTARGRSGEVR
jgi:hypothetical protein